MFLSRVMIDVNNRIKTKDLDHLVLTIIGLSRVFQMNWQQVSGRENYGESTISVLNTTCLSYPG